MRNHTAVASCVTVSHVFTPHGGAHKYTSGRRLLRQTVRQTAATVASRTHRRKMTALLAQRVPAWRTTPRGKVARCPARNGLTLPTRWKATKRANGACNTLYPGGREKRDPRGSFFIITRHPHTRCRCRSPPLPRAREKRNGGFEGWEGSLCLDHCNQRQFDCFQAA